jgi:hypothetical protein
VEVTPAPRIGGGSGLTIAMWVHAESDTDGMGLVDFSNARRAHTDSIDLRLNAVSRTDWTTPAFANTVFHLSGGTQWGQVAVTNPLRFPLHTWRSCRLRAAQRSTGIAPSSYLLMPTPHTVLAALCMSL